MPETEQYETSVEELKASNEELQAMNAELITVNQELKIKVEEVDRTNRDLQNLMASTRIATVFLDRDLRIKRFTPSAVPLFNLIPTDIGRPLSDLSHQLRYAGLAADAADVLDKMVPMEREIATSSGQWLIAQIVPYGTTEDRIAGLVLTFVDITTRKQTEESLRAASAELDREVRKFDAVVTSVPDFIFTFDLTGRFTYLNKALLDLWAIRLDQAVGRTFEEIALPTEPAATLQRQIVEVIATRQPVRDELGLQGRVYDYILAPILGAGGAAEAVAGTIRDVTARKEAEQKVRAGEERYRLIFESTRDFAILTVDLAGVVTSWNPGAVACFGFEPADIIGQPFATVFTPADQAARIPESVLAKVEQNGWTDCERWHVRKDGTQFWGSGVLTPMAENGRPTGYLKIMRDTTAERRAMEDRQLVEQERARLLVAERDARQEAESANEAKDRFLAILSHELRTPLAPIHMTLYTLEHEKRLSKLGRESLAIIRRSVEMEVRLIDDLLDVSRIVHGKLEPRLEPMDLHACVLRAIEVCKDELAGANLQLVTALEAAPAEVSGDAARLQQVFWNLLKNAAKFSPRGGMITVSSRNRRRADGTDGIVVEIADNGIGIDPAVLPNLFNAFEQGGPDVVRRYGGLGLGLAIASGVVQMHGGTISAASEGRDKGTVITVELKTTSPDRDAE
jgi:two-component system CheB/CheR fusion protein